MQRINVALGDRSYDIIICNECIKDTGNHLSEIGLRGKVGIVTNPVVNRYFGRRIRESLKGAGLKPFTITIPNGERYKTLKTVTNIYDKLVSLKFERGSSLIALGGGVIGDITGFAAATYLRGIPYIQVPTTLLAQVDSSVGGKTAVDHRKGKNLIGAFYQPQRVLIDIDTLHTLPRREFIAGMAEVVKYGVIADEVFFNYLEENLNDILSQKTDSLLHIIKRSCEIKAHIVEKDERDVSGRRAILNFGHTFGHAIETITGYKKFKHGEAVAIGMVMAARLAVQLNLCSHHAYKRIKDLLNRIGLPTELPKLNFSETMKIMQHDKKVSEEKIKFILPKRIGEVISFSDLVHADLKRVIEDM
ncbi:MAG: 3-dehydroquinate synthase [Nitrospirae bacterium]|nr:3-dehydroquinate synthase [Nitrospirota bacterium]